MDRGWPRRLFWSKSGNPRFRKKDGGWRQMIYTPQNALGSLCVDVLNGKYIHQVIEVDAEASTVTVIDSPARIENDELVVKKLQFESIVAVDREGYMPVLFLCKRGLGF
ncbi:MAG: hypothetical protein [Caudoviricetes sp.]|nr:MAG: hypothetical protein [Caudoviricetes sp.]